MIKLIKFAVRSSRSFYLNVLKLIYHNIPLSEEKKIKLKTLINKYSGLPKKNMDANQRGKINNEVSLDQARKSSGVNTEKTGQHIIENILDQIKFNYKPTVTAFIPFDFLPQTFGGGVRIMNVYGGLSNYFNINLVGVTGYGAALQTHKINNHLTAYLVPMSKAFYDLLIREQQRAEGLLHDILLTNEYKMIPQLVDLCKQLGPETDVFISEQPYFIKMLLEYCNSKIIVYEAQNVDYDLKKTYFKDPYNNEAAMQYLDLVKEVEALACQRSDIIMGVSDEDVDKLCRTYEIGKDKVVMIPNGMDVYGCKFISTRDRMFCKSKCVDKRKHVVFVGSAHGPNIEAVEYILDKMAGKNSNIRYTIIGNINSVFANRKTPPNVHFSGMISAEGKVNLYKTADLAINPMFSGSGTNLKVLEYAAYGLPIISTAFGMRGLAVFDGFVYFAERNNFFEVMEKVLSLSVDIIDGNTTGARNICERHFDKSVISSGLVKYINGIGQNGAQKKSGPIIAVEGRILHRNVTGSERYIYQLAASIAGKAGGKDYNCCLVNASDFRIEGLSNISYIPLNKRIDLYHRTYQLGSYNDLIEMALAGKSVFSFLDLILCKRTDYFKNEADYTKYVSLMKLALNLADRIIAISEHAKKDVIETYNIPEEKIDVVYLGLDFNKFRIVDDREAIESFRRKYLLPDKYILYVGTDYPHKNLKNLYIAFSKIMHLPEMKDFSLVIAGMNYHKKNQQDLLTHYKTIEHRVVSLGYFADDKMELLYNAAAMSVIPSLYEGFGLTALEAFACGTPLICSDATSLPEVAGDAAYMVDATNPDQIAKAMLDVVRDAELRNLLIKRGLQRAAQFTWEKCAENTLNVYRKTLSSRNDDFSVREIKLRMLSARIFETGRNLRIYKDRVVVVDDNK
jgi:glycosyltransferase involved in cell wall biosynthesis